MTTIRRMTCMDLFKVANINYDVLTETYNLRFYLSYFVTWPNYHFVAEHPDARLTSYIIGKAEGKGEEWHGHVTAVTVAPEFRKMGLAGRLMNLLEDVSEKIYRGFFVDLFVRKSNRVAINMYKGFGYAVYREVIGYYSGEENAYDMRKALSRDPMKKSMIPLKEPVHPHDIAD